MQQAQVAHKVAATQVVGHGGTVDTDGVVAEARTAVAEVDAGEGELIALLTGQHDCERVDRPAEIEDKAVGTGVDVGGMDVAVVDMQQRHNSLVGVANDNHARGGIVNAGLVHHNLHLGETVGGGDGDATEAQGVVILFVDATCEGHALDAVYTIVGGIVALSGSGIGEYHATSGDKGGVGVHEVGTDCIAHGSGLDM